MRRTMQASPNEEQKARYQAAVEALNRGDWTRAQQLAMGLVRDVPPHGGVYFVAGVAARELLQIPLAIECLRRAVSLSPQRADYFAQLARALAQASLPSDAVAAADRAIALGPSDPVTLDTLGVVYSQAHAYRKAHDMFRRAVELQPRVASNRFNLATALIYEGETAAAEGELEACLQADPRFWKAYLTLSQLGRQSLEHNHVARFESALTAAGEDPLAAVYVHLALAKEHEDLGDYSRAFDHFVAGKAAGGRLVDYTFERDEAIFAEVQKTFAHRPPPSGGDPSEEPIFVFGLPRTGTTLVERIISSHPWVHSAGELQNFGVTLKRASGSRTSPMLDVDTLQRARDLDWRLLGERYIASTRPGTGQTPRFTDKLPANFLYAGHIAAALPNAKLVCVRRDPMDSCLSNFRQLFALGSPHYGYSYSILDTGRYYVLFDRLMRFWQDVMPGRIFEVQYEDLVDQQEQNTRRLIDFCGLPWDDACLRFEENEAPVATASALQVRSKIYRSAIGRWKRYGPELSELRALLEAEGIAVTD